jgi:hypothetical protein
MIDLEKESVLKEVAMEQFMVLVVMLLMEDKEEMLTHLLQIKISSDTRKIKGNLLQEPMKEGLEEAKKEEEVEEEEEKIGIVVKIEKEKIMKTCGITKEYKSYLLNKIRKNFLTMSNLKMNLVMHKINMCLMSKKTIKFYHKDSNSNREERTDQKEAVMATLVKHIVTELNKLLIL